MITLRRAIVLGKTRAGYACSRKVMAVVWNYFSRLSKLAGYIMSCFNSNPWDNSVVVPVLGWLRSDDGYLLCRVVPLIWIKVGQGLTVIAVCAVWGCSDIFSLAYHFLFFLPLSGRDGWDL